MSFDHHLDANRDLKQNKLPPGHWLSRR